MKGHRIHALVVVELEFDVEGEQWLPSRMAQEVQELVTGKGTSTSTVTERWRHILHMTMDNNDLDKSLAADMLEKLTAAMQGEES